MWSGGCPRWSGGRAMPRSAKRRLELLERRRPPARRWPTDAEFLAWLERAAAGGHPLGRSAPFQAAWADYMAARARLEAAPEDPPPEYRRGEPEAERRRMWLAWDHKSLNDAIC